MTQIIIDYKKCTGCGLCALVCSLEHVDYAFNPKKSRIRIFGEGVFRYPVLAGGHIEAECNSMNYVIVDDHKYDGCIFCRATCPAKSIFTEPDSEIPLKCDLCGDPPEPKCVTVCSPEALTLVEDEELVEK